MSRAIYGGHLATRFRTPRDSVQNASRLGDEPEFDARAAYSRIKVGFADWYPTRDPNRVASDLAAKLLIQLLLADIERLLAKIEVYP